MQEQLEQLIGRIVTGLGFDIWGVEYRPHSESALLRIFIEKEGGITIDDCTAVSRQVGAALDVEDLIPLAYVLEVSSPGIDRVLFTPEQYQDYLGHAAKIRTRTPVDGRRNFRGTLQSLDDDSVTIHVDNDDFVIPFNVVDRTRLVLA